MRCHEGGRSLFGHDVDASISSICCKQCTWPTKQVVCAVEDFDKNSQQSLPTHFRDGPVLSSAASAVLLPAVPLMLLTLVLTSALEPELDSGHRSSLVRCAALTATVSTGVTEQAAAMPLEPKLAANRLHVLRSSPATPGHL